MPYQGASQLGQALFGDTSNSSPAYMRGAQSAARVEQWLAGARKTETEGRLLLDTERARKQFEGSLVASGENPEIARVLTDAFAAGYDPKQLSGYQAERQKTGLGGEAAAAARGGDIELMNNLLTAFEGKPRQRTNVEGGVAYDPYGEPGQAMAVTPTGQASIGATNALAVQRYASAGQNDAHAALYGRTDPNRSGTGAGSYTAPTQGSLSAVFSGEDGAIAGDQARDFMIWRQANPQYRNGEEALAAYTAAAGGDGGVNIISANRPGSMTIRPPSRDDEMRRVAAQLQADGASPEAISQVLAGVASGGDFAVTDSAPTAAQPAPGKQAWSQADALKALADARRAIQLGRLTTEQAQQRLIKAGLRNLAGRL